MGIDWWGAGTGGRGRGERGAPPCEGADTQWWGAPRPPARPSPSHLHEVILKQQRSVYTRQSILGSDCPANYEHKRELKKDF